jgi:hypothetical protein
VSNQIEDQRLIRRYLLQSLTDDKAREVETRVLTDSAYAEEVDTVEEELIDEYLAGELTGPERKSFELIFLSTPQGRQQVDFGRALMKYISENAPSSAPTPSAPSKDIHQKQRTRTNFLGWLRTAGLPAKLSLAAAGMVLLLACALMVSKALRGGQSERARPEPNTRLAQQGDQTPENQPSPGTPTTQRPGQSQPENVKGITQPKNKAGEQREHGPDASPSHGLALTLEAGRGRGEGGMTEVGPDVTSITLKLRLRAGLNYDRYGLFLKPNDRRAGEERQIPETLAAHNGLVIVDLPVAELPRADYKITLKGSSSEGEFEYVDSWDIRLRK